MRYQDLKVRDARRLAILATAIAAAFVILLLYSKNNEAQIGSRLIGYTVGLAAGSFICWCGCIYYLVSSPAQNARFLRWYKNTSRSETLDRFDWSLLDASDPDYDLPTLRYLLNGRRRV